MNMEEIVQRFLQYFSHMYDRKWQAWELFVIVGAFAIILMLILIARRRKVVMVHCLPEQVPLIGARLIDRNRKGIMSHHWRAYLLILLLTSLSLVAMWLYVQGPRLNMKVEPAPELVASSLGSTAVSGEQDTVAESKEILDIKVDPFTDQYQQFYAKYKNKYAMLAFSNEFIVLPDFDPSEEAERYKHGYEDAGCPLPDWETGQFGSIPPRRIVQILGPDDMLVAGLFSEDGRLVRFRGWLTVGLRKGQIWPNPKWADPNEQTESIEVAVAGQYKYRTILGKSITVPSVVPLELFREGITLEQFKNLLLTGTELPSDLRQLKLQLQEYETAFSDENPRKTNQASL